MVRRHALAFTATLILADAATAIVLALFASLVRFGHESMLVSLDYSLPDPRPAALLLAAAWVATLWAHGLYRPRGRWTWRSEVKDILRATIVFAVLTLAFLYVMKLADVSRLLLVYLFPALAASAIVSREILRAIFAIIRLNGRNTRYVLIVGANERAQAFADLIEGHRELGLMAIGHVKASPSDNGVLLKRPLFGGLNELPEILHTQVVDEVAICLPLSEEQSIEAIVQLCGEEGKIVRIPVAVFEKRLSSGRVEELDGLPVFSLVNGPDRFLGLIAKRIVDIVGSAILLLVFFPVFIVIAALIKLDSPGPVHFRQDRVGLHGRTFRVLKFRTMCAGAEEQLDSVRHLNEISGHAFKIENDPRVTRVGRWLRKISIDELPQLWNVLFGEMSLVGPRPPLPDEVAAYDIWHRRRLSMKPGMTGLWQVGGRRDRDFDRWVEKDLEYIDRWSLWLDFKIIARTVPAILSAEGR